MADVQGEECLVASSRQFCIICTFNGAYLFSCLDSGELSSTFDLVSARHTLTKKKHRKNCETALTPGIPIIPSIPVL